jgi:hypothetical protein
MSGIAALFWTAHRMQLTPDLPTAAIPRRRRMRTALIALAALVGIGLLLPGRAVIPVAGASARDWNPRSFWYEPWGASGVHKGIDIFAAQGRTVVAATAGIVIYRGEMGPSGNAAGKAPHLHYAVVSLLPLPWRYSSETQGWRKMFYLDPASAFQVTASPTRAAR